MPTPAYAFFKDDEGGAIDGGVEIADEREGSVEVIEFYHDLYIPTDTQTGKPTGTRMHKPVRLIKEFDVSSPYLYEACCNGTTLEEVEVKWYRIAPDGSEEEYYTHLLEGVKVASMRAFMPNTKDPAQEHYTHLEEVSLVYSKITWTYVDGSIETSDSWTEKEG